MPICSGFPSIKKPTNHIFGQGEKSELGPTKRWKTFPSLVLMGHTEKSAIVKRDILGANVYDHWRLRDKSCASGKLFCNKIRDSM